MSDSGYVMPDDEPRLSHHRSDSTPSRRRVLSAITATAVGGSAASGLAGAGGSPPHANGRSVQEGDDGPIRESAWVDAGVDTDEDGTADRVYVEIARPQSTADGEQLPVIAIASPYNGEQTHGDSTPEMTYDRAVELSATGHGTSTDGAESVRSSAASASPGEGGARRDGAGTGPAHRPRSNGGAQQGGLAWHFLQEGYVVATVSSLGTHRSTGCYTAAGPPTADALEAVVDWFNGRAEAFDAREGGAVVAAEWTNGKTGMMGTSALGELANAVATTGVDGLEAIVPQSADASQYSMFRANGTPISVVRNGGERMAGLGTWIQASNARRPDCDHWTDRVEADQDRATGDYNDFWHEREFLTDADAVDAGVLITHGLNDPIVKPNQFADWYETLHANDVPVKLWLFDGGHTSPRGEAWTDLLDRWWAYWLKDADNGVMDEPPVSIVRDGVAPSDGGPDAYDQWPVSGTESAALQFGAGGGTSGRLGPGEPGTGEETLVDDPSTPAGDLVRSDKSDHRLRYETPPLRESVHVSGRVVPSLSLSFDDPTVVSVALVEDGDEGAEIVTRGWADPLNRPAYSEYDTPLAYKQSLRESSPLAAGERVQVEFPLQATDHVFARGSRLGVVVYATDRNFTLHPPGNSEMTLSLADSSVAVPAVGGASALSAAIDEGGGGSLGITELGLGGGAVAALGGAGYALKRRFGDDA